jgi:cobalt-zinc-cadmium resistance protein CzcA
VFIAAGLIAFSKLNIEAYPNPAPVILEITAQAAGLSAEEMERYYTMSRFNTCETKLTA